MNPPSRPSPQRPEEQSPVKPFDPWKNVWKLDWGPEGSPADRPQTPESLVGRYAGGGGFSHDNSVVNAMARSSGFPAVKPLGLFKPGLENAKPGDMVFGRDGVLRPYAAENALLRAVDRLTARVLEPRPEQGGASFPGYGTVKNVLGNGPGGTNSATGVQPMSSNTGGKSYLPDPKINTSLQGPNPPDTRFQKTDPSIPKPLPFTYTDKDGKQVTRNWTISDEEFQDSKALTQEQITAICQRENPGLVERGFDTAIYNLSQQWGINPKVLLTTLAKSRIGAKTANIHGLWVSAAAASRGLSQMGDWRMLQRLITMRLMQEDRITVRSLKILTTKTVIGKNVLQCSVKMALPRGRPRIPSTRAISTRE